MKGHLIVLVAICVSLMGVAAEAAAEVPSDSGTATTVKKPPIEAAKADEPKTDEKQFGILQVVTDPPDATVYIGKSRSEKGWNAGKAPAEHEIPGGQHWVIVEKEGYQTTVAEALVTPGERTILRLHLQERQSREVRTMRGWGHGLLWPGVAVTIAGIVLIEVDPQGDIGKAGMVTGGVGIAAMIAGGILLGLTYRPPVEEVSQSASLAPPENGRGLSLFYNIEF